MYLLLLLGNEQVIHYQIYNKGKKYGYSLMLFSSWRLCLELQR